MPRRTWTPTNNPSMRAHETTIGGRFRVNLTEHRRNDYRSVTMFILDKESADNREGFADPEYDAMYLTGTATDELRRLLNWAAKEDN